MSRYQKRSASPSARYPTRKHERRGSSSSSSLYPTAAPAKPAPPVVCAVYGYLLHADNTTLPENLIMPLDKKGVPQDDFFRWVRRHVSPVGKELVLIKLDRYWTLAAFSSDSAQSTKNKSVADFLTKDIRAVGAVVLYKRAPDSGDGDDTERVQALQQLAEPRQYIQLQFEEAVEAARARIREQLEKQMGDAARHSSSSE